MYHDLLTLPNRRRAWVFEPTARMVGTVVMFHGSTQTLPRFRAQVPVETWAAAGFRVAMLGARLATGRMWLPVLAAQIDTADIDATQDLLARLGPSDLPLWLAGHSGGACFAHLAGIELGHRVSGIVSNAGWVWDWARRYVGHHPHAPRVCFRVGERDKLFNCSPPGTAFGGADAYAARGCAVRPIVVPGGRHEWLSSDDPALIEWLLSAL